MTYRYAPLRHDPPPPTPRFSRREAVSQAFARTSHHGPGLYTIEIPGWNATGAPCVWRATVEVLDAWGAFRRAACWEVVEVVEVRVLPRGVSQRRVGLLFLLLVFPP